MRPLTISLSPNTEKDDIRRAWYALLHPKIWSDASWLTKAKQELAHLFPNHNITLTSSGRQALYHLLKAYGVGAGDEVIIQAFACIAVPAPIIWTGATPIYADINPATYNLDPADVERKITPRTKVIIVQHTFGIPGPVKELQEIARRHNLKLIEDCPHALGQTVSNQPLGTFGDAAIFSFGRDKVISSVFGGAIITKDEKIQSLVTDLQSQLRIAPKRWVRQQLLHPILMDIVIPNYFRAAFGKVYLVLFQKFGLLSKAVAAVEKTGGQPDHLKYTYSPALAYLLVNQFPKLDRYTKRRREITARYVQEFGGPNNALLRFPLQHEKAPEILQQARQHKILLGDWYNAPLVPPNSDFSVFKYSQGSCPVAEQTAKRIINLPTYPLMTDEQVEEVIRFVRAFEN